jgi:hypothetical protein
MSDKDERGIVRFLNEVFFFRTPREFDSRLSNSTTPSIEACKVFICSGTVVSVTNFLGGVQCQTIKIIGDGNTTLVHGTYIKTNTGANKVLAVGRIYCLTLYNNVWYEE